MGGAVHHPLRLLWRSPFILLLCLFFFAFSSAAPAQQAAPAQEESPKIAELLRLLQDEDVRTWLAKADTATAKPKLAEARWVFEDWEAHLRGRFNGLLSAIPHIPGELYRVASAVREEARAHGLAPAALILLGIAAVAFGAEWLFRRSRPPLARAGLLLKQVYEEFLTLAIFTVTATVVFLLFSWPPLTHVVILYSLLALIAYRGATALMRLCATASIVSETTFARFRVLAAFVAAWISFSAICERAGVSEDVRSLLAIGFSVPVLGLAIAMIWHEQAGDPPSVQSRVVRARKISAAVLLWLFWCAGFHALFWLGLLLVIVPRILSALDRAPSVLMPARAGRDEAPDVKTVLAVRAVRAIVIIAAADWVSYAWRHDFVADFSQATLVQKLMNGIFNSVVILLVIDFIWQLAKSCIARKLDEFSGEQVLTPSEMARRGRFRTLLPVFRNALAAMLLCIAALTVLSQMGVEIGPLIAGAGVAGVAIGFGSQTLVKDVVSGVFYLLDDAFRVGEYIEAGSHAGVVESFSLRSVRLRHHRGPISTVPFGSLGAIKNLSRDWAVDKFRVRVPFKTDLEKVRKIVKTIGQQLQDDPDFSNSFIQPLKLKGVEQIGEFGVELGVAFTCRPGDQTMIRRRAYSMLMQAFEENGIDFAQPVVQVSGDEKDAAAAAHAVQQIQNAAAASAPAPASG